MAGTYEAELTYTVGEVSATDTVVVLAADPPDVEKVCESEYCAINPKLRQECEDFLKTCLALEAENKDECVGYRPCCTLAIA